MEGMYERDKRTEKLIYEKLAHYPPIVTQYCDWLIHSQKTLNTIYAYIKAITHFINYQFDNAIPDDFYKRIDEKDISIYLDSLDTIGDLHDGKISNSNKATKWSALNSFFQYLTLWHIDYNPVGLVSRPVVDKAKKTEYLTIDEVTTLLNTVQEQNREKIKNRDICIMMLGFYCGLRSSAIIQLNINDIDWTENKLRVLESGNEYYEIPLSTSIRNQLKLWLADRTQILGSTETDALFVSAQRQRISDDTILHLLKTYSVNINKVVNAQIMRNTCIVNLYLQTKDLALCAKLLNQTNIASVYRYIEKLIPSSPLENAVQILDDLYNFTPSTNSESKAGKYEKRPVPPMPIPQEHREQLIKDLPIEDLDLTVRTYNCLKRANVSIVADILELSSADILQIRNIGPKVIDEIVDKLENLQISVDQSVWETFLAARKNIGK